MVSATPPDVRRAYLACGKDYPGECPNQDSGVVVQYNGGIPEEGHVVLEHVFDAARWRKHCQQPLLLALVHAGWFLPELV